MRRTSSWQVVTIKCIVTCDRGFIYFLWSTERTNSVGGWLMRCGANTLIPLRAPLDKDGLHAVWCNNYYLFNVIVGN